ncbi:Protein soga3 [Homalodisca vitripennis]|nr:Protein soga3 [Homalodisca vitripennis]
MWYFSLFPVGKGCLKDNKRGMHKLSTAITALTSKSCPGSGGISCSSHSVAICDSTERAVSSVDNVVIKEKAAGRPWQLRGGRSRSSSVAAAAEIWKDDREGSLNSIQSLDERVDTKFMSLQRRDPSLDSRLSGGSTQSEVIPSDKKVKKGLFGKLKKLTKSSRSVDHDRDAFSEMDRGSDTSLGSLGTEDPRGSKKDLKDRIVDMFKKSGSTSRGGSMERTASSRVPVPSQSDIGTDSTQRPLRATSMTRTEPSPARSDVSQTSTASLRPPASTGGSKPPNSAPLLRKVAKK